MKNTIIIIMVCFGSQAAAQVELSETVSCPSEIVRSSEEIEIKEYYINSFIEDVNNSYVKLFENEYTFSEGEVIEVTNSEKCGEIGNFLSENDFNINSRNNKFYYQSNDHFFVFYAPKQIGMGPKLLFLVIKKDFREFEKFYF